MCRCHGELLSADGRPVDTDAVISADARSGLRGRQAVPATGPWTTAALVAATADGEPTYGLAVLYEHVFQGGPEWADNGPPGTREAYAELP